MRSRGLDRNRSDLSFTEDSRTMGATSYSVELSASELDKSQGEQEEVVEPKRPIEWNNNDRPEPEPEPDY